MFQSFFFEFGAALFDSVNSGVSGVPNIAHWNPAATRTTMFGAPFCNSSVVPERHTGSYHGNSCFLLPIRQAFLKDRTKGLFLLPKG